MNNTNMNTLMEQITALTKEIKSLKNGSSINETEDRIIKIKSTDYDTLTEMIETLHDKCEEQDQIISNYEAMHNYNMIDESNDAELNQIMTELDESINELNRITINRNLRNTAHAAYSVGSDISIQAMQETALPILSELNEARTMFLGLLDDYHPSMSFRPYVDNRMMYAQQENYNTAMQFEAYNDNRILNEILDVCELGQQCGQHNLNVAYDDLSMIDESVDVLSKINNVAAFSNSVKDKISSKGSIIHENMMNTALSEAASDITIIPGDKSGYSDSIPEYRPFSKVVYDHIDNALKNSGKSVITTAEYMNDDMIKDSYNKFELPIANPEKWNVTIKSAIANLSEALVDLDGNVNIPLCEQAYLYKKVSNPTSIKDFAMPIAVMDKNTNQLYAHPTLISNVANILKKDTCIKTYEIPSRERLYSLRESLMPYLEKIGMEAPWLEKNEKKSV